MKQTTTTRYLNECLELISYPSLPEKLEEGIFWTKAIVLINKEVNPMYGLAIRGEDGQPIVKKVFTVNPIITVDEIYPYEVDKKIIQKVNENTNVSFAEWKADLKVKYPNFKQNVFTGKKYEDCKMIFADWLKVQEEKQKNDQVIDQVSEQVNNGANEGTNE